MEGEGLQRSAPGRTATSSCSAVKVTFESLVCSAAKFEDSFLDLGIRQLFYHMEKEWQHL